MPAELQPMFMISSPGELLLSLLVHGLLFFLPVIAFSFLAYYLLSLPAKRHEHARFFLHLLEICQRTGKPIEHALVAVSESRDRSPGMRFHLTSAYVEEGDRLAAALEKSRLCPRSVIAMLAAGEYIGDVAKVLPACRMQLQDARSGIRNAMNHFLVLVVGLAPLFLAILWMLSVMVMPKFREIFGSVYGTDEMSGGLAFLSVSLRVASWVETLFVAFLAIAALLYLCGPGTPPWIRKFAVPFVDSMALLVPWKRRRMQRNFAAILAVLLDVDVPEPMALKLAAASSGNDVFRRRAGRATQRLADGETLTQAVTALDSAGEFRWRLTNAAHGRGGFAVALRGWFEGLDARAFQQEQATSHVLTTGLVIVNGVMVGCICIGVFGLLTQLVEIGVLW